MMTLYSSHQRSVALGAVLVLSLAAAGGTAFAVRGGDLSQTGAARRLEGDQTAKVRKAIDGSRARNVILFIGDGMGDSEITSARYYQHGAAGRFPGIDSFRLTGQYTTYSLTPDGKPDYDPDSAATGSAWATGTKTYDGAISVDLRGEARRTLLELAKRRGLRTGNVTTSSVQDATPAVQVAHVTDRDCTGPVATSRVCPTNATENGGRGSITEQLLRVRPDVTLGGGAVTFDQTATAGPYVGQTLFQQADARGYRVVRTAAELAAVRMAGRYHPLLGLFAPSHLPVLWTGPAATPTGATQPAVRCTPNPEKTAAVPDLRAMTRNAIRLLDRRRSTKGFFLQVESASIDKRDHAADACGQIGETVNLDRAVRAALRFAKRDRHTTVIVTADHGHTSQIVETGTNTPGLTTTLLTADDAPMTLNYATSPAGKSQEHTGTQVRIAGYGPRAANVAGLTDQTDLFFTIADALRLR
jgi:alkaline phosphatase